MPDGDKPNSDTSSDKDSRKTTAEKYIADPIRTIGEKLDALTHQAATAEAARQENQHRHETIEHTRHQRQGQMLSVQIISVIIAAVLSALTLWVLTKTYGVYSGQKTIMSQQATIMATQATIMGHQADILDRQAGMLTKEAALTKLGLQADVVVVGMIVGNWGTNAAHASLEVINSGSKPADNVILNNSQLITPTDIGDPIEWRKQQQAAFEKRERDWEARFREGYRRQWGSQVTPAQMAADLAETHKNVEKAIAQNREEHETMPAKAFVQSLPTNQLATYSIPLYQVTVPEFFYLWGSIRYDTLGEPRTTPFCWRYDPTANSSGSCLRFQPQKENAEQEK